MSHQYLTRGGACWCLIFGSLHRTWQSCCQQIRKLSPAVFHRWGFDADQIPAPRQGGGLSLHQCSHLATHTIADYCRADSLWCSKRDMHACRSRIRHHAHSQNTLPYRSNALKTGESETPRNTADHAERRARPLARRDFRMARPERVFIRLRKPCFFARRRLLG